VVPRGAERILAVYFSFVLKTCCQSRRPRSFNHSEIVKIKQPDQNVTESNVYSLRSRSLRPSVITRYKEWCPRAVFAVFEKFANFFGALLVEFIYSLATFRQQPCPNFAKIATFVQFANVSRALLLRKIATCEQISTETEISSKSSTKFRQICHFRHCLHFWTYLDLSVFR